MVTPPRPDDDEGPRAPDIEAALAAARNRYAQRNPASAAAHAMAVQYMPGGNTRSVLHFDPFPLFFECGKGSVLTDVDGHDYDDFLGEYTAGLYGHSHPRIRAAIDEGLTDGLSLGGHNLHEAHLARLICVRFPAIELVRFANSGTEANLMALAAARVATGRHRIMAFSGGYHGGVLTFGSPGPVNAPFDMLLAPYNDVEKCRSLIRRNGPEIAAVIVEPMLQSGGCIPALPGFLEMLRAETLAAGALLIFDEVVTSRLHPAGQHGALGIHPDLVTLGKYIGAGFAFGAFGGNRDVMAAFDPRTPGFTPHAGTFNNNILSMRVAFTGLSEIFTPDAAIALNARGDRLRTRLNDLATKYQAPLQFTGLGSVMGAHFTTAPITSPLCVLLGNMALRELFFFHLLEDGIYLAKRGMIALSLTNTDLQIARLEDSITMFLERYRSLMPPAH